MTWVTESSTVLAEAPGYTALITTAGGAICGYIETGSARSDSRPASMMTMAITQAKIGRSMKKRGMVRLAVFAVFVGLSAPGQRPWRRWQSVARQLQA